MSSFEQCIITLLGEETRGSPHLVLDNEQCMRHNNGYIWWPYGSGQKARSESPGTETKRDSPPSPRLGDRRSIQSEPIFRSQGSSSGPLRDAPPAPGRGSLDCRRGRHLRHFAPDHLSGSSSFRTGGTGRPAPETSRAQAWAQAFSGSDRVCAQPASFRFPLDHCCLSPSHSGEVWDHCSPAQSRAGAEAQKKNHAVQPEIADGGGGRGSLRRAPSGSGSTRWTTRAPGRPCPAHAPRHGGLGSSSSEHVAASTRIPFPICGPVAEACVASRRSGPVSCQSDSQRSTEGFFVWLSPELPVNILSVTPISTFGSPHRARFWRIRKARNASMPCAIVPWHWAGLWNESTSSTLISASPAPTRLAGTGFRSWSVKLPSARPDW